MRIAGAARDERTRLEPRRTDRDPLGRLRPAGAGSGPAAATQGERRFRHHSPRACSTTCRPRSCKRHGRRDQSAQIGSRRCRAWFAVGGRQVPRWMVGSPDDLTSAPQRRRPGAGHGKRRAGRARAAAAAPTWPQAGWARRLRAPQGCARLRSKAAIRAGAKAADKYRSVARRGRVAPRRAHSAEPLPWGSCRAEKLCARERFNLFQLRPAVA
jgi:hypothetical protein